MAGQDGVDAVVQACLVATAPTVEVKVQRESLAGIAHRDGAEIATPGVVATHLDVMKVAAVTQSSACLLIVRGDQQHHCLELERRRDELGVFFPDRFDHVLPVAVGKRPHEHDRALALPFGGKSIVDRVHLPDQPFGWLPADSTAP